MGGLPDDDDEIIDAISYFTHQCDGYVWQAVIDFRRVSFSQTVLQIEKVFLKDFTTGMLISMDISRLDMGSLLNCMVIGGESWLMSKGLLVLRRMVIGEFKQLKKRAEAFAASNEDAFRSASRVLSAFGCDRVVNPLSLNSINADQDTSLSNEDWYDNMSRALDGLRDFLEAEHDAVNQVLDRLALIADGNWEKLCVADVTQEIVA
jgi:hypothetical protein